MSQSVKLPYKIQLNTSINNILLNQRPQVVFNKQLPIMISKLYKIKIKHSFKQINNFINNNPSPSLLFKQLLLSKTKKKQPKPLSYLPYKVKQQPNVNNKKQVPKTSLFNLRIKLIKQSAFLLIKSNGLKYKNQQLTSVLVNRQSQLLNHLIPKIQEKILIFGFRKIIEYAKQQKGRFMIVGVLDKLVSKVIVKRVGYSEFFNKLKRNSNIENKQKLSIKKLSKIIKLSQKLSLQQSFQKILLSTQSLQLQQTIQQKKQLINQVYARNTQRTVIVQQQRQLLRNLKYKLDQQAVEKSHVLTDKRRALVVVRARVNQQNKVSGEERVRMDNEVDRLQKVVSKQQIISQRLSNIRKTVRNNEQISYEQILSSIYHQLIQLSQQQDQNTNNMTLIQRVNEIINNVIEQIVSESQQQEERQGLIMIPTLESIQHSREYKWRRVELLQSIVRYIQWVRSNNNNNSMSNSIYSQQPQTPKSITASQFTPRTLSQSRLLQHNNSASTLSMNNNNSNLMNGNNTNNNTSSRVSITNNNNRRQSNSLFLINEPIQYTKSKQQLTLLQQIMKITIKKHYQLQIKHAITEQLQQLSQLLVNDMKQQQ